MTRVIGSPAVLRPVGANQKRYVLGERFTAACYMISVCHRVEGPLDPDRMRAAAAALVARHEALRTAFRVVDGSYVAVTFPVASPQFHVVDLVDDSFASFRAAALPLILRDVDVASPESLVRFVLGRVAGGQSWRVCFAAHHSVSDGVSRALAMKQLFALYDGTALPPVQSYYDILPAPADLDAERAWWSEAMAGLGAETRLVPDVEPSEEVQLGRFVEDRLQCGAAEYRRLVAGTGASSFGCMAAVFALGLLRLTGQQQPMFAFQSAGRAATSRAMSVFGPFSNTLPLHADLDLSQSFAALAKEMQRRTEQAVQHEALPFDQILRLLPAAPDFSLNSFPRELPPVAEGLVIHPREFLDRQSEFAINLVWSQDGTEMVARAYYDAGRISEARARDFLRAQKLMMQHALQRPESTLSEVLAPLGGVAAAIAPRYRLPPAQTVVDRVVEVAHRTPEAIALREPGRSLSYGALLARADAYGAALLAAGAQPGDAVAILGTRSSALVAACLGAARAGTAFAVLDTRYPKERLQDQCATLAPRFLIRTAGAKSGTPDLPGLTEVVPEEAERAPAALPGPVPGAPLYTLFTSGTTGQPKAVSHGCEILTFFTDWARERFSIGPGDCVTMLSGLNHDPVMRDIFLPLSSGACLAIPSEDDLGDPARLRRWLREAGATVANLTPPMGRLIGMAAPAACLPDLRLAIWGGDELTARQAREFRAMAPAVVQVNLYGATETPQAAALAVIPPEAPLQWRSLPIGRTVDWVATDCVTSDGRICGTGETGMLRVTLPFPVQVRDGAAAPVTVSTHETGDRASVAADGQFVFLGRADDQIKIRGFRVELKEVGSALESLPGVRRALVLPIPLPDGSPALEAWCEVAEGDEATSRQLAHALKRKLPEYMVPHRIHRVAAFPLLPNGKIDRRSLAATHEIAGPQQGDAQNAAPEMSPEERAIATVFARVSGRNDIGPKDCLADLGADSLSVIETRLRLEAIQANLPVGWELLPIRALADRKAAAPRKGAVPRISFTRLESFVAIRSIAIVLIVAVHMGWFFYGGGATVLLFMIAGFTFGRFTLPAILECGSAAPLWRLLGKILATVVPIALIMVAWQMWQGRPIHGSTLGLYANFVPPTDQAEDQGYVFWLWYIHSYIQAFAVIGLALSFPAARRALQADTFGWALALAGGCAVSVELWALAHGAWMHQVPWVDPVARLPMNALAMIGIGLAATQAWTGRRKLLLFGVTLLIALMHERVFEDANSMLMTGSLVLLLFVPWVWVPQFLGRIMLKVSGASLFIYAMHWPLARVVWALWGPVNPALLTFGIIAICATLWQIWQPALRWMFDRGRTGRQSVTDARSVEAATP